MRQIPYTMMKFAAFERTVEFLYKHVVPVPRDTLGYGSQLAVTFAAGYIAGVFCAVVSHPADSVVSKLNSDAGSTAMQALRQLGFFGEWCTGGCCSCAVVTVLPNGGRGLLIYTPFVFRNCSGTYF